MRKEKVDAFIDSILKHSKVIFPVVVIAAVAATVSIGLSANRARAELEADDVSGQPVLMAAVSPAPEEPQETPTAAPEQNPEAGSRAETMESLQVVSEEVPLMLNEDEKIYSLVTAYYTARAAGDYETLAGICDELSANSLLHYVEMSKYLNEYPSVEIYTKHGPVEGSTLAYVYYRVRFENHEEEFPGYEVLYICDDGQGGLYIKTNEDNFTEEEKEYIQTVTLQDDAVEFYNRVDTEFNDMVEGNPSLAEYLNELEYQVDVAIGAALAEQNAIAAAQGSAVEGGQGDEPQEGTDNQEGESAVPPENLGPQYASAVTTVNVRSSDSEQADKLGKISAGTRVQVQDIQVNGWTKVVFEGNDGYIKSEYLQIEESTGDAEAGGTVTALQNVRIRAAASLEAESLGLLEAGASLEYYGTEDGWCKVNYNGTTAYVKAEYVSRN